jgi:hypothetical protein
MSESNTAAAVRLENASPFYTKLVTHWGSQVHFLPILKREALYSRLELLSVIIVLYYWYIVTGFSDPMDPLLRNTWQGAIKSHFIILGIPLTIWCLSRLTHTSHVLSKNKIHQLAADRRQPFIFLRSFNADRVTFINHSSILAGPLFFAYSICKTWVPFATWHLEDVLARQLARYGPVFAIGLPGEHLPTYGAGRFYVDDAVWQDVVKETIQAARLIFLQVEDKEGGVKWELHTLRDAPPAVQEKSVLITVDSTGQPMSRNELISLGFSEETPSLGNAFFYSLNEVALIKQNRSRAPTRRQFRRATRRLIKQIDIAASSTHIEISANVKLRFVDIETKLWLMIISLPMLDNVIGSWLSLMLRFNS